MSEAVLTTRWGLEQSTWLDEALVRREWQRARRQWASGRWMGLLSLLVLALWLPALTMGSYAGSTIATWHWPFASLSIVVCLCGLGTAFLRSSQIWSMEARNHALEGWLLSQQSGKALAFSVVPCAVLPTLMISLPALGLLVLTAVQSAIRAEVLAGVLALYLVLVVGGAATGSGTFFVQVRAVSPRLVAVGGACLAAVLLALWLRVENVEHGWTGPWERHPGRGLFALLLLSPVPYLMGLAAPELWQEAVASRLGAAVPAGLAATLFGATCLVQAGYAVLIAARGFRLLREDPERLEKRPVVVEKAPEAGSESYWAGFRNPIWTREVRTRLRSREAVECIFFASVAVAVAGFFPLLATGSQLTDPLQAAAVARQVFQWLTLTLGAFVMLITPGLTAEAITLERERGTLDLLLCSPMSAREILHGKLLGAVSILVLFLSPSLPLFGLCAVFHGAAVQEVLGVYLVLGVNVAVCAYFGVTASAIQRQMVYAKFQAYVLSILFGIGPAGFISMLGMLTSPRPEAQQVIRYGMAGAFLMLVLCLFVMALSWGHALERLQYSETGAS